MVDLTPEQMEALARVTRLDAARLETQKEIDLLTTRITTDREKRRIARERLAELEQKIEDALDPLFP